MAEPVITCEISAALAAPGERFGDADEFCSNAPTWSTQDWSAAIDEKPCCVARRSGVAPRVRSRDRRHRERDNAARDHSDADAAGRGHPDARTCPPEIESRAALRDGSDVTPVGIPRMRSILSGLGVGVVTTLA